MLRVGVVGNGYWGSRHLRVLHQVVGVDEVAVIDERPCAQELAKRSFPATKTFDSLRAALPALDAVVIATPPSTHEHLGLMAIRAGKHVLVEKPMATSTTAAHTMIVEAELAGVILMVGHTFRYSDAVDKLHEIINTDDLGPIQYIDTSRLNLGIYQRDVNVVWDLAPHDISIVNHLLGRLPSSVQAWGSCHMDPRVEDVAYLHLHYSDSEITAVIAVSWLSPCKVRRVTVVGTRKMAVYDDMAEQEPVRIYDKCVLRPEMTDSFPAMPMSYRYGDIVSPYVQLREPLMREDQDFVDCIQHGQRPASDGPSGLAVVKVLEAATASLQLNAEVEVDTLEPLPSRHLHDLPSPLLNGARR